MKAAVFYGAGDIRIEEVDTPKLETPGDVIIRVRASGICGSDLHPYRQAQPIANGHIMGHEYSGEIAEIGSQVQGLNVGDRVVAVSFGANAEYIRIPGEGRGIILPISAHVSFEEAATIEPLANSIHIAGLADPSDEETIVIFGMGIIGLGTVQALRTRSSARVIAVDFSSKRLSMAEALGADVVINAGDKNPFREVLDGTLVDTVCDCAGLLAEHTVTPPVQLGLQMLKQKGKLIEHAILEKTPEIDLFLLTRKEIRLLGSWGFNLDEYAQALEMIQSGKVDRKPLITHTFPLESAKDAFEVQLKYEEALKVLLNP